MPFRNENYDDFFKDPDPEREQKPNEYEEAEHALSEHALHIGRAALHLKGLLVENEVKPNRTLAVFSSEVRDVKRKRPGMRRRVRVPEHTNLGYQETGQGWQVAAAQTRYNKYQLVMSEAGRLHIGEATSTPQGACQSTPYINDLGAVRLSTYPFHDLMPVENGYSSTGLRIPQLVEDGLAPLFSEHAYVAANLEKIEQSLRDHGRELLRSSED